MTSRLLFASSLALALGLAGCGDGTADPPVDSGIDARLPIDAQPGDDASDPVDAPPSADARASEDAPSAPNTRPTGDGGCTPITNDSSAVGDPCGSDGVTCPAGYTCQGFSGVVFAQSCQILCTRDCECPADHACQEVGDKAGTWLQCNPV